MESCFDLLRLIINYLFTPASPHHLYIRQVNCRKPLITWTSASIQILDPQPSRRTLNHGSTGDLPFPRSAHLLACSNLASRIIVTRLLPTAWSHDISLVAIDIVEHVLTIQNVITWKHKPSPVQLFSFAKLYPLALNHYCSPRRAGRLLNCSKP